MEKLKWCIKRDASNEKEIDEILSKAYDTYDTSDWVRYVYKSDDGKLYLSEKPVYPDYKEITIEEFRLLTNPERYEGVVFAAIDGKTEYWKPFSSTKDDWKQRTSEVSLISNVVMDEWQRMVNGEQSHYSANPEVTTTLDPITEYKIKGPDGTWSFDFANEVEQVVKRKAESLKSTHRKNAMIAKLERAIKAQKKALRELKELRDQLNAEVNY